MAAMSTPQYPQGSQDPMPAQNPQGQPLPGQPYTDPQAQQAWGQPQPQPWGQVPPQGPGANLPVGYQQPAGLVPTTPPPVKSTAKVVLGWFLVVWTVLGILSLLARMSQGNLTLIYPRDIGMTFGTWLGLAMFHVLPAWGAWALLTSHQRAMQRWRQGQPVGAPQPGQLPPYQ